MRSYAERALSATIQAEPQTRAGMITAVAASEPLTTGARRAPRIVRREPALAGAARNEQAMGWRDLAQSFAQDAAEMPIVSRLLAGQALLALGYAGLRGALALRGRSSAHRLPSLPLAAMTAAVAVAFAWGALALVSRTRAAPAITAYFAYGQALRQYLPPRLPLKEAA